MTQDAPLSVGEKPHLHPSSLPRRAVRIAVPLLILAVGGYLYFRPASYWTRCYFLVLAAALCAYLAVVLRGRLRDAAAIATSVTLGLAGIEAYYVHAYRTAFDSNTPGYSVYNRVLGWGPEHPGVYHHTKTDLRTGRVIVDVDYTIDAHLTRKVDSPAAAPTVAFAGGSDTFGIGVPDAATLPQAFADAIGRRLHVVNLAFSGYGPQHFLRILETGLHDDILTRPRAFIFPTSPGLSERAACNRGYALHAPRYGLVGGQATFEGSCADRWSLPLRWLFEITSVFDLVAAHLDNQTPKQKLDLYVAVVIRAGEVARAKYGVPTVVLYYPDANYTEHAGSSDEDVIARLRAGGLIVLDGTPDPGAFPGRDLAIPGDGHPTPLAHRLHAEILRDGLAGLVDLNP